MTANKNTEVFEKMPVPQALLNMAVPTIISQLIVLIYNMADTFYLGRTNNPFMVAGASIILPVFNMTLALAGLVGVGGGSLISRLLGAHKEDEARRVSAFCLNAAIAIAAFFSLFTALFMTPLVNALGAGPDTAAYARLYASCVIVIGAIPTVLSNSMATILRSVGYSKPAGFGLTMGGVLNIFLDPLFMFVIMPSGKEIAGAGIATCISNCIACAYFFHTIHKIKDSSVITFSWKVGLPSAESIKSIFGVGIPSAFTNLLFDIDNMVINRLMAGYGDIPLAAMGIVLKAERLPLNVGVGICLGMMPLVAYNYAAKNRKRTDEIISFARTVGLAVGAVSIILYELGAGLVMRTFIADAGTVAYGTSFLRIRAIATPLMFLSFFTVYIFQGFGKGRVSMFLGIMRWGAFNIPMLFLMNHLIGMYGICWSQLAGDVFTVSLSFYVFFKYRRQLLLGEEK